MKSKSIFTIDNCSVVIENKTILKPLSFNIYKNDFLTITGKSGCGKSTLLQVILGFIEPSTGKIYFGDEEISTTNIQKLRDQISVVFQEPCFNGETILQALLDPFTFKKNLNIKPTKQEIDDELNNFNLKHIDLNESPSTLSGGEKQRFALVRALLLKRKILVLDEISSALDAESKNKVQENLLKRDITIINISHDTAWIKKSQTVLNIETPGAE